MNLAIKGHYTRGEEVIKILEMLGGRNVGNLDGNAIYYYYTIMDDKKIIGAAFYLKALDDKFYILSLEEFLEKFPYKVGDKVQFKGVTSLGPVYEIEQMKWEDNQVKYIICDLYWKNIKCTATTENLQPYKEETMEERQYKELRMPLGNDDKLTTEATIDGNKITPPNNYLIGKITKVDNGMLVEFVKKQPQYPKTYKECCEVLSLGEDGRLYTAGYKANLIQDFQKLLICRDAYWKIAGEEMGLGKPWEPDGSSGVYYFFYCVSDNRISLAAGNLYSNEVFAFPTKEMRNAFLENFEELIEICKELL